MTGSLESRVRSRFDPASIGLLVVVLLLGPPAVHAEQPPVALTPPPFPIMGVKLLPGDGSSEIRNYTDYDIKTCFYYPGDNATLIPNGIKDDKDNCYSTLAVGKKDYRTDSVGRSMFRKKPEYFHPLERHLNVKIFRKTRLGSYKKYCTKHEEGHLPTRPASNPEGWGKALSGHRDSELQAEISAIPGHHEREGCLVMD